MALRFKIAAGLFALSILCLFLYSKYARTFDDSKQLILLLLASGPLAYVLIFSTYIIVVKKFNKLKHIFYDLPLNLVRISIHGSKNLLLDVLIFYASSAIINFCSIYFLAYTPVSNVLSHIPGSIGFENIAQLNSPAFDLNNIRSIGNVTLLLPYMAIGPVILFILRKIRHRARNIAKCNYPGSRAILAFVISMFIIYSIQYDMEFEKVDHNEVRLHLTPFYTTTVFAFGLSAYSFILVVVIVISDRFLFSKLQSNPS